jgi:hypothetical protein
MKQKKVQGKRPNGHKWTNEEKIIFLTIYKKGPRSNRLLQKIFNMSSVRILGNV